jgi:flagellar hook protein FlgE
MSFTQGLSGLSASSKQLDVIGNNVANANTVGFKGSVAEFGDVFATALSGAGSSTQTGIGAQLLAVAQQFSKGNITSTNSSLDVAINGAGFFMLNNQQGTSYSRNGQFELDKNGFIVNSAGDKLQGYAIDPNSGLPSGSPTNLTIPTAVSSAAATGQSVGTGAKGIVAGLNFNSTSLPPTYAFDPANPTTFNKSTSTTTYDSKGVAQTTTMYFVKSSATDTVTGIAPSIDGSGFALNTPSAGVTTVTPANPIANLVVGAVIQGGGFPTGTTIASVSPVGAGPYTSFTTSANPATTPVTGTAYPLTIDVPNNWNIYTTVTDPTTGAYLYPTPAYNTAVVAALAAAGSTSTNPWVPNGTLTFGTGGTKPTFTSNTSALATTMAAQTDAVTGVANGISGPDTGNTNFPGAPDITFQPTGANQESFKIDYSGSTQFGTAFGVNTLSQDGYTAGQLSGFTIGSDGIIQGTYSNSQTKALGQIALATFPNNQGLQPLGSNEWAQTGSSGAPVVNAPGTGNNGVLQTSATEASNVDLTTELVNMMTAQRSYQANAQTIKTADSVMQTLLNMR